MEIDTFLRLFPQRCSQIMWFLGAGASTAANIPTAGQMIWDFKRQIYCSQQRVPLAACENLMSPAIQNRIQRFLDDTGGFPIEANTDEYAFYFEQTFPSERDRRTYIAEKVSGAHPSFGHQVLAELLKCGNIKIVWTTNFDRLVEDASAKAYGSTAPLTVADLGEPDVAIQAITTDSLPLLGKIHGDFQSRRLKNTTEELRFQDLRMRSALVESCRRFGLAIVGYSGRDASVMDALEEAIATGVGFPSGIFWFHRPANKPIDRVLQFVEKARDSGIDVNLIEVESFDELFFDIAQLLPKTSEELQTVLNSRVRRATPAPIINGSTSWPVVRTNALPIFSSPSACRRVSCKIGGQREVREAVDVSGATVIARRKQQGVIAFGSDAEIRKAFEAYDINEWAIHPIESHRLRYESQEQGLIYDGICRAIARERPVRMWKRQSGYILTAERQQCENSHYLNKLKSTTQQLGGRVPQTQISWSEALSVRLDFKLDRLWLLLNPTIWIEASDNEEWVLRAKEFRRDRLARRYNREWSQLLDGWISLITGELQQVEIRTFGIGDGLDAAFTVGRTTGFSWRGGRLQ